MVEVGSPVLFSGRSGVVVSETSTHWNIVGFAGTFEEGPLCLRVVKKGSGGAIFFGTRQCWIISALVDSYKSVFPASHQQKSAKAHAALLSFMGQTKGYTDMVTKLTKEQADARSAPARSALKIAKEQEALKANAKKEVADAKGKPAPAPAKAAKPAAKAEKPAADGKPGRTAAIQPEMKVKLLVTENPKRAGAATRFALYKDGMTVAKYLELGGTMADVRWDAKQKFISVA